MKKLKALSTFAVGAIAAFGMMATAYASGATGNITIDKALSGEDYSVYRILELESFDAKKDAYSYVEDADWKAFLESKDIKDTYVTISDGYVSWVEDADAAAFAKLALKYAKDNGLTADETVTASGSTAKISNLELGYYLLDSSVGTMCSLDTTNPDVTIHEKNTAPTIDKEVEEVHGNTDQWGDRSCASIGDTVNFRSTVTLGAGSVNLQIHDTMEAGLTFNAGSVAITKGGTAVASSDYTVKSSGLTDKCTFEISFSDDFLASLQASDELVVTYSAVLNENAEYATESNDNTTWLTYGDKMTSTEKDITHTYTYLFDLIKTDKDGNVLTGAEFKLYDAATKGNEIALVATDKDGVYRVANEGETAVDTVKAGHVTIEGLGSGTYYLEETVAPEGFNKLKDRVEVVIDEANNQASLGADQIYQEGEGGVRVINKKGIQMPSTGSAGTMGFYAAGMVLIAGASGIAFKRRKKDVAED